MFRPVNVLHDTINLDVVFRDGKQIVLTISVEWKKWVTDAAGDLIKY